MKRTGFIAIVGRPNVGKSTLLNALTGEKISIVSKKPQTTRTRITGILTRGEDQFVFLDTPGMHRAHDKLDDYMSKTISGAIGDVDAAILVAEADVKPTQTELALIERFKQDELPAILVINKIDRADGVKVGEAIKAYSELYDFASIIPISAMRHDGIDIVLDEASKLLYESEWHFDEDELTDQPEKQIAAEVIREKLLRLLDDEIPHGVAVVIEEFSEKPTLISIRAEIFCEKESHKGIIIGKNGEMLKTIGSYAREDLEKFFECKVYINLWVKVKERWRESAVSVANFGFNDKSRDE